MPIENEAQAIEALTTANNAPESQPIEPVQTDTTPAQVDDQPRIDPASLNLPPEAQSYLQQREREMQADYTRKTQEVAEQRREAEQAMEFVHALNTDPSFAYQVHDTLTQALQAQGFSTADAQAMASEQLSGDGNQPWDEYDEGTFNDPYAEKIQQLESWQAQQEQRFAIADAEARINAGVNAVRQANPNYTDADVKDILTMAFAYNGDVAAAEQAYKAVTQRVTEGYLNQKASVPANLNQPASVGHAEIPPEGFSSLNDPRLEEAAKRMLAESDSGAQW
jgi:hypothetical protein